MKQPPTRVGRGRCCGAGGSGGGATYGVTGTFLPFTCTEVTSVGIQVPGPNATVSGHHVPLLMRYVVQGAAHVPPVASPESV
jgi:hypothetical protein